MRKLLLAIFVIIGIALTVSGFSGKERYSARLYFVDASMQRLIPTEFTINAKNADKAAKAVVSELISGRDNNKKILRLIPDIKDGLSVKVKGNTAYVNMSDAFVKQHSDARPHELLTIYSIVNSLTSIDGIVNVKFTIDNKIQRDFKGFCDMRETFIPDYYI